MSDFRDALRHAAAPHGEAVGTDLTADAVLTSSAEGIRRGRRRRTAGQALVAAAGVAVIGVGAWLVLPLGGARDHEPASEPVHAGPYRYEVGADPEAFPLAEPEVLLRGDGAVMCGDQLSLTPGVHVHDAEAFGRGLYLAAELETLGDIMEGTPPATPQPLFSDWPDGPTNAWDPATPQWETAAGGAITSYRVDTLLLDGGAVVGVRPGGSGMGQQSSVAHYGGGAMIPAVGQCGEVETREDLVELWEQGPGDPFASVLVAQFWGGDVRDRTLLATIVIDPNEPSNTDREPDAVFEEPPPASLERPEGTARQSFIVPRPEAGCAPLADTRADGRLSADMQGPRVEMPGVTEPLTGQLWAAEPVLSLPAGEEPWYLGRDAWLVADSVSAGIKDPHLEWTSSSGTGGDALAVGGDDPLRDPDCVYPLPVPEVLGAVFLVVDGVAPAVAADWDDAGSSPDQMQTWIYLGQAD